MALHAATNHDVEVVGVTLSAEQAAHGRARVEQLGLADRIDIRIQDYREIDDGPFDAISSVGMAEHVGAERMPEYFSRLYALLRPGGRVLNHAISSVGGSRVGRRSFVGRYVFPDGELLDVADTVRFMEGAGFEVRDVENLREHYAQTLRCWVANLQRNWDDAVDLVGEARCRVWLLYMSGSINGFEDHGLQINQTLGVRLHDDGRSDMCRTRHGWVGLSCGRRSALRCRPPRRLPQRLAPQGASAARRRSKISGGSIHGSSSVPASRVTDRRPHSFAVCRAGRCVAPRGAPLRR